MSIGPIDMSLAIQALPQVAAISKASEEAPRVAAQQDQLEFAEGLEEREERVAALERLTHVQAADREGRKPDDGKQNERRQGRYTSPAESLENELPGDDGQHLIDVSV